MNRLKDLREDHDLKQQDVAEILKISRQYYQCYEAGKNEMPIRHYVTLAKYYNVSLDYIAGILPRPRSLTGKETYQSKYDTFIEKYKKADPKIQKVIRILLDED